MEGRQPKPLVTYLPGAGFTQPETLPEYLAEELFDELELYELC